MVGGSEMVVFERDDLMSIPGVLEMFPECSEQSSQKAGGKFGGQGHLDV